MIELPSLKIGKKHAWAEIEREGKTCRFFDGESVGTFVDAKLRWSFYYEPIATFEASQTS